MYDLSVKPEADKLFARLAKKDKNQFLIIHKKAGEILANPHHDYKFLRKPLQGFNRVHIDSHFVLIFKVDHSHQLVEIYHYGHHDTVYQWQPKVD